MKRTQFKKGQSGNPNGRPKGTPNKTTAEVRQFIQIFLDRQFDTLDEVFNQLTPKEKVSAITKLLPYIVPKQQHIDLISTHTQNVTYDFSKLSDEELYKMIELSEKAKPNKIE